VAAGAPLCTWVNFWTCMVNMHGQQIGYWLAHRFDGFIG
jgi:hypothetical protein